MENKTIETVIAETIKSKGLVQKFISQKTDITETNLSLSLNGKRKLKSNEFVALCALLNLELSDFEFVIKNKKQSV